MRHLSRQGIWLIGGLLSVAGLCSAITVTTPQFLSAGTVGAAYSVALTATGGTLPYSWSLSAGTLPPGLTLSPDGTITGTPTLAGIFPLTVVVTDAAGAKGSGSVTVQMLPAVIVTTTSPLKGGSVGSFYSSGVSASGGTGLYTWRLESGTFPPGFTLTSDGQIWGTPTAVGIFSFAVTVTDSNGGKASATFTLQITAQLLTITTGPTLAAGTVGVPYSVTLNAAGGAPPYKWSQQGGTLPPGLTLSPTGILAGTPTLSCTAGCAFSVTVTDSASAIANAFFTIVVSPVQLIITTSSPLPAGTVGVSYLLSLHATGGDAPLIYSWSLLSGSLPRGMALSLDGVIAGTPFEAGSFLFTAMVTIHSRTAEATFALTIAPASLTIDTSSPLSTAFVDQPYFNGFSAHGGVLPYSWTVTGGQLPPGLSLTAATGVLNGTPTAIADYSFTVQVSDAAGTTATRDFVLSVQSPPPYLSAVRNSASYSSTIAQGAMFVIFGYSLGPATLVQASVFPLPNVLAGTSVTVTSGGVTLDCPLIYVSASQVAAILPSSTPLASAETSPWSGAAIVVTVNGKKTGDPNDIYFSPRVTVVPSATGLYTIDSSGAGPGIFTALDGTVKTFTNAAKRGEILTTWATGAGPIDGDDAQPPTAKNLPGFEVWVGSQSARVVYAGPSPCCAGLDQISFELPQVPDNCFMPVMVRGGGVLSNSVTLAIDSNGGACSDVVTAIPQSIYTRAAAGEQIRIAAFAAGPQGVLSAGGFPMTAYLAARLSAALRTKVAEEDVARLLQALEKNNARAVRRAMWKYRARWNALDPKVRKALLQSADKTQDGAGAAFFTLNRSASLMSVLASAVPPSGACTVTGDVPAHLAAGTKPLDAGTSLSLSGPVDQKSITAAKKGVYTVLFGPQYQGPTLPAGDYTISGAGGQDVGSFSVTLSARTPIVWTNPPAAGTTLDATQPLTFTWSGGNLPGHVILGGSQGNGATFLCSEDMAQGMFTVPAVFLSSLASGHPVALFIAQHPLERQVSVPGMDIAYFVDAGSGSVTVPVK